MTHSTSRRASFALDGLAAAILVGGLMFGQFDERRRNRIPRPLRMLSSALVLLTALLNWRSARGRAREAARLLAGGMSCGLLGDLIMAKVLPLPKPVIGGMLSFGVGHVLYMRAFFERKSAQKLSYKPLSLAWVFALVGWWSLVRRSTSAAPLKYGALDYTLLLGTTSGLATALAMHDRRYARTALGSALFFASDAILAAELVREAHFTGIGDVVWLTYIAGQALIVGVPEDDRR